MKRRVTAIDTFSGAGGLSLGLHGAGVDVRCATDWDEQSINTYLKNLSHPAVRADVRDISGNDLLEAAGVDRVDLIVGGPPCQGFSRQRRGADFDERNELVYEFVRLIDEVRPRAFLMENVAAIGGSRGREFLAAMTSTTTAIGYKLSSAVLDAADFGVPQHRRRMFIVGVYGGVPFEFPEATHTAETWMTVREAFRGLPDPFLDPEAALAFANHERDNISAKNRERISFVPEGGGREDIPAGLRLPCHAVSVDKAGHRGVYGRLWWDRPSGTVTTKCNSFTRGRFAHPSENRNITMREAARLQGFPDDFVFLGDKVSVAHQIGNAVPPPLAKALGLALLTQLGAVDVDH